MTQAKHPRHQAHHSRRRIGVLVAITLTLGVSGGVFWLTRNQTATPSSDDKPTSIIQSDADLDTLMHQLDAVQITGGEGSTAELEAQARFGQ